MLVIGQELHHALLWALLMLSWSTLVRNFEVESIAGRWVNTAHFPRACVADTTFGLSHRVRLLVERNSMPYEARHL